MATNDFAEMATGTKPQSLMAELAGWVASGGVIVAAVGLLGALNPDTNVIGDEVVKTPQSWATLVLMAGGSVIGLGALMWMLGAIENRLIEVRELLRKPEAEEKP